MSKLIHPTLALMGSAKPYPLDDHHMYRHLGAPPMLIEDFLPEASVMGMTALPGVGKSWLVMEAMRAVATGTKFLNEFQAAQGGVLFIGSDSSLYDYARQWRRLTHNEYLSFHTVGEEDVEENIPYDSVRWLIQSPFLFEDAKEVCNLIKTHEAFQHGEPAPVYKVRYETDEEDPDGPPIEIREQVDEDCQRGFKLIVFDTLSRLTHAQQNDNTEMERVFGNIRLICEETRAAVILVHHNSKPSEFNDGSDWRGAMAQIGALDSWVNLSSKKNEKAIVQCAFKKFRGITPENFRFRMNVTEEETASLVYTDACASFFDDSEDGPLPIAIRTALAGGPPEGMPITDIAKALTVTMGDMFPVFAKLRKAVSNRLAEEKSPLMMKYIEKLPAARGEANLYRLRPTEESDESLAE